MHKPYRLMVVGAGATLAEALGLGVPDQDLPPVMINFAKKMWREFNPHPILDFYLESLGYEVENNDGRDLFYELERHQKTDVEKFYEFAWRHKAKKWSPRRTSGALPRDYIHGFVINSAGPNSISIGGGAQLSSWENLIYQGIGNPLQRCLDQAFFENGVGYKNLNVYRSVGSTLKPGDVAVSLNYDPIFELGLDQARISYTYTVETLVNDRISFCKPHGSLNMIVSEDGMKAAWETPESMGRVPPPGWRRHLGIIPPRLNKYTDRHRLTENVMRTLKEVGPKNLTFWGVGLTPSDIDLLENYRVWARTAERIEIINPDAAVAEKFRKELFKDVLHYKSHDEWLRRVD